MTLDMSDDPFASPPDENNRSSYPLPPPVPTLLGIRLGRFSEDNRRAFIALQLGLAKEEYNFQPTPIEEEALAHYNSVFYNAEAKGAMYGMAGGFGLGLLLAAKSKKPWGIIRWPLQKIGITNPRYQHAFHRGVIVYITAQMGKTYGMISAGIQAFNKVREAQKQDLNMQRYLQMRNEWVQRKGPKNDPTVVAQEMRKGRENARKYIEAGKAELGDSTGATNPNTADDQGLGGVDFCGDEKKAETPTPVTATRSQVRNARVTPAAASNDDDPFSFGGPSEQQQEPDYPSRQARSQEQELHGSAWERLRRGELPPAMQSERGERQSREEQWPTESRRGFGGARGTANEDSFSFSDSNEGRRRAQEEAQREFDARMETERQIASRDAYEGESNSRRGDGYD